MFRKVCSHWGDEGITFLMYSQLSIQPGQTDKPKPATSLSVLTVRLLRLTGVLGPTGVHGQTGVLGRVLGLPGVLGQTRVLGPTRVLGLTGVVQF